MFFSRVHITGDTLALLDNKYEVEEGNGASRDSYLAEHHIQTFLIIAPRELSRELSRKKSVCYKSNKWTECGFGSDKPFANISETTIAKNVTQTVKTFNAFNPNL